MFAIGLILQAETNVIAWYWYLIIVLVALALLGWWIYQQSKKQSQEQSKEQEKQEASKVSETSKSEGAEDDLTQIEGIGPKVAGILKDAAITNFDSLAKADPLQVKSVLNQAGLQMMNPEGWIEQAQLAAKGDWDGLQKLQDELKGGRRK